MYEVGCQEGYRQTQEKQQLKFEEKQLKCDSLPTTALRYPTEALYLL